MFKITKAITLYTFEELSTTAKETAKEEYLLNDGFRAEFYAEDCDEDLKDQFPNSDLNVAFSCGCVQSDFFKICGTIAFEDVLSHIKADMTDKEVKTLTWVFANWLSGCDMADLWARDYISDITDKMECYCMRDIPYEAVEEFDRLAQICMEELESTYRKNCYDYLLNVEDEEMADLATANGWLFDESGNLSEYSMADIKADADTEKLYVYMDWLKICTEIGTDEFSKIA